MNARVWVPRVGLAAALAGAAICVLLTQERLDLAALALAGRPMNAEQRAAIGDAFLRAYRFQYIVTGVQDERFNQILGSMITESQAARIGEDLTPIMN